ncbi:MAG: sulfatase [Opitutaceae bacterium]|nr:sulfatase [Opitutaceae bacterium]
MIKRSRFFLLGLALAAAAPAATSSQPNVLFIAIDDQNDWVGYLGGHPQAKTPNIDRLAARGTAFTNAHCQATLCNPSRASLLTGIRPSSTGIHGLAPGIRDVETTKNLVSLPQTFTRAGYFTYSCGKIYHDGAMKPQHRVGEFNEWGPAPGGIRPPKRIANLPGEQHPAMDWGPFPERDEDAPDFKIADAAIAALGRAPADKPFFVACGFRLPHVPCFAPQKWFDLHPDGQLEMPPMKAGDRDDTPRFSWYLHWKLPEPRAATLEKLGELRKLVRAYLSSTSFMDAQVGRVLAALEASGRTDNTIIVLWSDHGYHLGEKGITGKNTLWERSTHVPLVFAGPGIVKAAKCDRAVELLDIFPTLLELAGLPARPDLEGHSLRPQLSDAKAPRPWPAITTHNQGNHSVRNDRWRYIHYADGSEELYDLQRDPNEWTNLARDPAHAATKHELANWLPKVDRPMAPGSAHRTLAYDPRTGDAVWEGKPIGKNDPIPQF